MSGARALVVEPAGNLWGSERVLLDFVNSVTGSPWQIAVCCPPNTPIVDRLAKLPLALYPAFVAGLHRRSRVHRLGAAAGLLAAALRFRPHLIYVNQAGATRIALLVGRLLRIPVAAHVRLVQDVAYVQSLSAGARELPLVLCISRYIRDLFEDPVLDFQRRLVVMYDPYPPQREWVDLSQHEPTAPGHVFACVGRLTKVKGQDLVLRAVDHLKREGIPVHVHFYGTGEPGDMFKAELAELAGDLGISGQIHWHGFQEEIPSRIASAAALICPSHAEPLGRVIFEAWDAGTIPVAWAGSGGPAEVIQASEGGLLYTEQTAASLARAMRRALDLSPPDRQRMVEQGRQWLASNCDPQAYGDRMLALWEEVAKQP
jgi:glycosyltransferase involved in cell wall biosynthesis